HRFSGFHPDKTRPPSTASAGGKTFGRVTRDIGVVTSATRARQATLALEVARPARPRLQSSGATPSLPPVAAVNQGHEPSRESPLIAPAPRPDRRRGGPRRDHRPRWLRPFRSPRRRRRTRPPPLRHRLARPGG